MIRRLLVIVVIPLLVIWIVAWVFRKYKINMLPKM